MGLCMFPGFNLSTVQPWISTVRMKIEQKKSILLDVIRESKTFFKLAELEKLGTKKGIVQNTVKDVLQELVDEGLVMAEKVGTSVLYWSFESDGVQKKRTRYTSLKNECKSMKDEIKKKRKYVENGRKTKEYTEERKELEDRLRALMQEDEEQRRELELFSEIDPVVYDRLVSERKSMADECNKLIDNIFIVQDYICNRFSMEKSEFNSNFNVPQDLDYIQ